MSNGTDVRQALAERLTNQAEWRAEKTTEYPEDLRNDQAAEAMAACAMFVVTVPQDDPRVLYLVSISCGNGVFMPEAGDLDEDFGEQESEFWRSLGFYDRGTPTPSALLDEIVAFYRESQRDAA